MGHYINNLWAAFTLAGSKEDIRLLFKDLFTHTEYKMFAKRLEIARRLLKEERYQDIKESLNVTEHTIAKISNILEEKGYGFRNTHSELSKMEEAYLKKQRQIQKDLGNPFWKKAKSGHRTLLGQAAKIGLKLIDAKIAKNIKRRSAVQKLTV